MENTSTPNPTSEPVSDSVSTPTMLHRNWLIPLFSIFVLLLLALTGYLYYQNQQLKGMLASYQIQTIPSPSASQAPNGDPADWKTYTNTKFNFRLDYPNGWSIRESKTDLWSNEVGDDLSVLNLWPNDNKSAGTPATENEIGLGITKVKPNIDLATWVKSRGDNNIIPNKYFSTIQVNGYEAIKKDVVITQDFLNTIYRGPAGPAPIGERSITMYIKNDDLITSFTAVSIKNSQDFITTFNQILSTFKFLRQDCSDSVINISITPPNSQWKCTIREGNTPEDKIIFLKREDGLQVAFPKITGVDSFPNNCPENITYVNLGDAHQPIKLCKNTTSLQSEILQQIVYNQTLSASSHASDGLFYIDMNTSLNLSASDKQELKSMFDSIRLLK